MPAFKRYLTLLVLFLPAPMQAGEAVTGEQVARIDRAVVSGSREVLAQVRDELQQRVRVTAEGDWLTPYTLAYATWRLAGLEDREKSRVRKRLLKQAQGTVEDALEAHPDAAELHVLRGAIIGDRIDGGLGGMFLGPKADGALDRAAELDPGNPRLALQRGISAFFTPGAFGGGLAPAEARLREALAAFDGRTDDPWPDWGRVDALAWLAQVCAATDRPDQARIYYRQALELAPGHAWIEGQLLPALDPTEP